MATPRSAAATDWIVAPGGRGPGTADAPLGSIEVALIAAAPGDTVVVKSGTYGEALRTTRDGRPGAPITLRAEGGRGSVVVTTPGTILEVEHSFITVEGLVFDGDYGRDEAVNVKAGVRSFVMRDVEVRHVGRDCINIGAALDVRIENSLVHHCLNATDGRTDAHGIVAGAVRGLTVSGTEIHTFSGDAIQLNRTGTKFSPGWDQIVIENCRFWLAPLEEAANGFPAGVVPGENALDTKVADTSPRASLVIRNTEVWGFGSGLIRRQAAFNLKENIDVTLDGVTVHDSEIAFRLRGSRSGSDGARVLLQNALVYDSAVGVRYENDIQDLRIWNTTFGMGVETVFQGASARNATLDVRNVVVVGDELPREADGGANLAVGPEAFVDAASHDYRLAAASPAVDGGVAIDDVSVDRAGVTRPQGIAYDVGAYERCAADCGSVAAIRETVGER